MKFRVSKIAAAIAAATMASSAGAVVVVGGDNGWEVSFDGNVNLFYNHIDQEATCAGVKVATGAGPCGFGALGNVTTTESSLNEGLLPAFFSTNIKSPTVNGLTGTARISFAPDSNSAKNTRNDKAGTIDMREVLANVNGSFGTVSFGRTLGTWSKQPILHDMTLFGVGGIVASGAGGTTLGRIGYGYIYPEFRTRFAYTTPDINGFKLEVGAFDPQEPLSGITSFETSTPQFQGEATYATSFTNGNLIVWAGGVWQEMDQAITAGDTVTTLGGNFGAEIGYLGFAVTGNYYTGEALGVDFQTAGLGGAAGSAGGVGLFGAEGFRCGVTPTGTPVCEEADNDGWYVQGTYSFGQGTKVGVSYGETNQDGQKTNVNGITFNDVEHTLWTVGVYHDLTSWLKLVAEYNNYEQEATNPNILAPAINKVEGFEADAFSVGAFMTW